MPQADFRKTIIGRHYLTLATSRRLSALEAWQWIVRPMRAILAPSGTDPRTIAPLTGQAATIHQSAIRYGKKKIRQNTKLNKGG